MNKIIYKKMSLFDAPEGSILAHACNAKGVWGSGIAKEFKIRYPELYQEYRKYCEYYLGLNSSMATGQFLQLDGKHKILCLITSADYGDQKDSPEKILVNTTLALSNYLHDPDYNITIYSNKFNSGLFNVPWENTEYIINKFLNYYTYRGLTWIVCDPDLQVDE